MRYLLTILLSGLAVAAEWPATELSRVPAGQDLRAFGRVDTTTTRYDGPDGAKVWVMRFQCANEQRAATVVGKFLADLDLSADTRTGENGLRVTASGAVFAACVSGPEARLVVAATYPEWDAFSQDLPELVSDMVANAAYPAYLDRFDRWGWGCYGMGGFNNFHDWMQKVDGQRTPKDPTEDVDFMIQHQFRFEPWLDPMGCDNSDGIVKNNGVEWMTRLLADAGMPWSFRVYGNAGGADWTQRRFPEYAEQPAGFLMSGWHGPQIHFKAQPHLTWFDRDIHRYMAVKTMDMMQPWADNPLNMGWMHPHGELAHDPWYDIHDDYSATARANWQAYLQTRGLDLAETARLYGRPGQPFGDWQQVPIPEFATFAGLHGRVASLAGTWFWRRGREQAKQDDGDFPGLAEKWYAQPLDTTAWQPIHMPGGDAVHDILPNNLSSWATTWFRREFTLTPAQLAKTPVYLYWFPISHGRIHSGDHARYHGVFVNGQPAGGVGTWGALDVTGLLQPGRNEIVIQLFGNVWNGRIFLSTEQPAVYPYLGADRNRLFILWQQWHMDAKYTAWQDVLDGMRQVDPDRPVKYMAPIKFGADRWTKLARDWGGFGHFTGEGVWYFPWYKRYGFLYDVPASSEPGGPYDTVDKMFNGFRRTFLAGLNAHDPVFLAQTYTRNPDVRQWWVDHDPVLKRMGKYDIDPRTAPQVLLYRSTFGTMGLYSPTPYPEIGQSTRLVQSAWNWDIGRGTLQTLGHSCLYLDDGGLADGKMVGFPLLFDCGNETMPAASVDAIAAWVAAGGTYVALPFSGRNEVVAPDSWPVAKLTGCRVAKIRRPGNGTVTIGKDQRVFQQLAGQTFPDAGVSMDYIGNNLDIVATELEPGPDGEILATFENGAAAIVRRRLGRGSVIALGTTFWRDSRDIMGLWWPGEGETRFLADLLNGIGFTPAACTTDDRLVWAQPYRGNNGLNAVTCLVSWHDDRDVTVNVSLRLPRRPGRIVSYGVDGEQELPFTWEKGVATVAVAMPAKEVKVLEVPVYEPLAAVDHWWGYQQKMWHQLREPTVDFAPYRTGKWADPTLDLRQLGGAEWSIAGEDTWTSCPVSILNMFGAPANTPLLLRQRFALPERWRDAGGRTMFISGAWAGPHYQGKARLTLNGHVLHDFPGANYQEFDVTDLLADDNEWTLEFDGDSKYQGVIGNLYLYHWSPPARRITLAGAWDAEEVDGTPTTVDFPGEARTWRPHRSVLIPKEWEGRYQVRLYVEGQRHDTAGAFVNGIMVRRHHHWFGEGCDLDITRHLRFGEANDIALFHTYGHERNPARPPAWDLRRLELHLRPVE